MDLIRKVENNVEFYTVLETGESGMSQSGLAILAGVSSQALIKLEATLVTSSPSECLQPFVGENLTLVTNNEQNLTVNGKSVGNLKIYKSSHNLAELYRAQGRYDEAEPLYLHALDMRKKLLGDEHPHTQNTQRNYQALLEQKKKLP